MQERTLSQAMLRSFTDYLVEEERSQATIDKYLRDIRHFMNWMAEGPIDKNLVLAYKAHLSQEYAVTSANSMLAALNTFWRYLGWYDLCLRAFRIQRNAYCSEEKELTKEEYTALIRTAERKRKERLSLVVQTICGTGIRVSELCYITVEAAKKGETTVCCKGKNRRIFLVKALRKKLLQYAKNHGITTGMVFVTQQGRPLNRSNIWREMKALCLEAGVLPDKVFPHNLRHLFARTFYQMEKDIAKLADILGHASINTTRIYILTTGAEHRRKMENMRLIL